MAKTLAEYYSGIGKPLPSISERAKIYESSGLGSANTYVGSAQQNTALLGKLSAPATTPQPSQSPSSTSTPGNFTDKNQVQNYLNGVQNNVFSSLESSGGPTLSYSKSDLASALVAKGGYSQTDANNAANGPRADELAKEFLGITGGSSSVSIDNGGVPSVNADTLKSFLPTGEAPAPINRNEILNQYRADMGVDQLETNLNDLKAQQDEAQAALRTLTNTEKGKQVALGVMDTRISVEQQNAQDNLEFIQRQISRVTDQLNTSYSIINTYVQNDALDYQDAVSSYNTKFDQGLNLFETLWGVQKDTWSMQQQVKATASTNLGLYVNAVTQGNIDYGSLDPAAKAQINKLEMQAGLPLGFVSSLKMNPKDQILFTNTDNGVTQVGFIDPVTKQVSVKSYGTPTPTKQTESQKLAEARSGMEQKLAELGGSDGLVSAAEWKQQKSIWIQAGYPADEFDNTFRGSHVDEKYVSDYGLKPLNSSNAPVININK